VCTLRGNQKLEAAQRAQGRVRGDPDTWAPPAWPPSYRGVVNTLEVAHADFVWRVRKHARVRQARRAPPGGDGGMAGSACHTDGQLGLRRHDLLGRRLCA